MATSIFSTEIVGSVRILVETKLQPNKVGEEQLRGHLKILSKAKESSRTLLVLTPDEDCPKAIARLESGRLKWASFAALHQAIDELLDAEYEVVSEREGFLLRQLQAMLAAEGLVAGADDVAVVAARHAWPEYQRHHAYICQADRAFRPVSRMAFYCDHQIYRLVPKILDKRNCVEYRPGHGAPGGWLGELMNNLAKDRHREREVGKAYMFIRLTARGAPETVDLGREIPHRQPRAFTQGQRYVSLEKLRKAGNTSDLE